MNELALFAGAGGGILGGHILGWRTVCAVEIDAYARSVLLARQRDRCLPAFPIWDDVRTFDGRPWRGRVDVVSGGFPCQDISAAGKGVGITGERSGLWKHMARIVGEVGPRNVFVENSPMLVGRGLAVVLSDLSSMGYDSRWGVIGAHHVGAPHQRDRLWIVANPKSERPREARQLRCQQPEEWAPSGGQEVADPNRAQRKGVRRAIGIREEHPHASRTGWWETEPRLGRVVDELANRVDRLRCIGNGQVPSVAALAWRILSGS